MSNELKSSINPEDTETTSQADSSSLETGMAGTIADRIGTGKNAKDSFIWMTITWSFIIASGLSILFFILFFCSEQEAQGPLDSILSIWGVFAPIITLALGYAFGKGE